MTTGTVLGKQSDVATHHTRKGRKRIGGRMSDEVVAAAQHGDRDAQWQLYESSHQNVYRLMVRMAGVQDADDLTQQVFLQAFRKLGQFSGQAAFGTWLYRLAVNEALQFLRRDRKRKHQTLDWEPTDGSRYGERTDQKDLLDRALSRIDPELRAIFLLREVDGLAYGEIAQALQIPEGTVGSRLNRARRELQQCLAGMGLESRDF